MGKTITFDIIGDFYKIVEFNVSHTGFTKTRVIEALAKHGAQLLFVENLYVKEKDFVGLEVCKKLKMLSISTKVTPNGLVHDIEEVDDIHRVIKAKLKKSKQKISVIFEPGFEKYLNWHCKHYHRSMSRTITLLLQYGTALKYCGDNTDDYSELDRKYFEDIQNHVVHYDPDSHNIILNKIVKKTSGIEYNERNSEINNEISAGSQGLQTIPKTTTNRQVRGASIE